MGKNVLSCQFLAGLKQSIKEKLLGTEGDLDLLLTKARFEEAKNDTRSGKPQKPPPVPSTSANGKKLFSNYSTRPECYACGLRGHLARDCWYKGRAAPQEAKGKNASAKQIASLSTQEGAKLDRVQELKQELQIAELEEVLETIKGTLHHVTPTKLHVDPRHIKHELGQTPTATVLLEGVPVEALLDTGSPVSIVSLEKLLDALARTRPPGQTPEEWKKEMQSRFVLPSVVLKNYGGGELSIVGQIEALVTRADFKINAVLQAQSNASVDMLIGTDLLPALGFAFVKRDTGKDWDLLSRANNSPSTSGNKSNNHMDNKSNNDMDNKSNNHMDNKSNNHMDNKK